MEGWGGDWPAGNESESSSDEEYATGAATGGLTRTEIDIPDGAVTLFMSGGSGQ